jgi:mono/diheme cytochrome c family protein
LVGHGGFLKTVLHLIWVCSAISLFLGCGTTSTPEIPVGPNGEIDPALAAGKEIWAQHCSNCHGTVGQGGRGRKLNSGVIFKLYPEVSNQIGIISSGKGQNMPAFATTLSVEEIEAVSRYIREVLNQK